MVNDAWHIPALHHSPGLAIWEGTYWILMAAADRSCNAQVRSEWWEEALRWLPLCYLFSCCTPFPARGLPSTLPDHVGSVSKLSGGFARWSPSPLPERERERLIAPRPAPPDFLVLPRSHSLQAEGGLQWRCPAATGEWHLLYMLFYVISCCFMLFPCINQSIESINLSINQSYLSNHI